MAKGNMLAISSIALRTHFPQLSLQKISLLLVEVWPSFSIPWLPHQCYGPVLLPFSLSLYYPLSFLFIFFFFLFFVFLRPIRKVVIFSRVWGPHPINLPLLFWTPFNQSGITMVLLRTVVCLAPLYPFFRSYCETMSEMLSKRPFHYSQPNLIS